MKLNCTRKDLVDAIGFVSPVSGSRSPNPVFQSIRLQAEPGQLRVTACNGEVWAENVIQANVETPGELCVPGKVISDLVSRLPDGVVNLNLNEPNLEILAGASDWKLMTFGAAGFPSIPEVEASSQLTLSHTELVEAINAVAYAVAGDESRQVLTGVLMRYDGNELVLVATDTHRLAVTRLVKDGIGSSVKAVVPEKALRLIKNLPVSSDESVAIGLDESRLVVQVGTHKIVAQLLAGVFPDWERVVPQQFTRSWTLDRQELIENLRRVQILARDSANRVRFGGGSESVLITARSEEKGEAKEEVPAVMENGEIQIAFNGEYVLQAVDSLNGDSVVAQMTEPGRAAVFRPGTGDGPERFCVIMPMAWN